MSEGPRPADSAVETRRSRLLYILWAGALSTLLALGLVCWKIVVPALAFMADPAVEIHNAGGVPLTNIRVVTEPGGTREFAVLQPGETVRVSIHTADLHLMRLEFQMAGQEIAPVTGERIYLATPGETTIVTVHARDRVEIREFVRKRRGDR